MSSTMANDDETCPQCPELKAFTARSRAHQAKMRREWAARFGVDIADPALKMDVDTVRAQVRAAVAEQQELERRAAQVTSGGQVLRVEAVKSGRAMARTGLRMMPTFPSPPLK